MMCFTCNAPLTGVDMNPPPAGFRRPFYADKYVTNTFVWDADQKMAASFDRTEAGERKIIPRGWGRIQNHKLMDEWEAWFNERVDPSMNADEAVQALNA